ncbi:hypothetical protein ACYULU_02260 [Breznakiellaceae bacterium SP9]
MKKRRIERIRIGPLFQFAKQCRQLKKRYSLNEKYDILIIEKRR